MEINGIAHVQLTVADFDACQTFYERLLVFLGLTPVMRGDSFFTAWVDARVSLSRGGRVTPPRALRA